MNATTVRLGDVVDLITKGTTPTTIGGAFSESGVPFVRAQNIVNGSVNFDHDALFINEQTHNLLKRSKIKSGDVLVAIAGTIGRVGVVPDSYKELNCNQAVALIRVGDRLSNNYLKYWLQSESALRQIRASTVVGVISNLSLSQIANLVLKIPPLPQQKRIAAILDKAEEIKAKREEAVAKLDELASSIFTNSFVSKGLPTRTLQQVCELITDGTHYTPKDIGSGYPFLTVKDMSSTGLDLEECSFISKEDFELVKAGNCSPQIGDVLFSKDGTVGKVHVVTEDTEFGVLSSIAILRPNSKIIHPQYLGYALKSPEILSSALAKKTGAAIRRIILANLKNLTIPLPTLNQQEKFVNEVNALHDLQSGCRLNLLKLNELLASLQHQAFTTGFTA